MMIGDLVLIGKFPDLEDTMSYSGYPGVVKDLREGEALVFTDFTYPDSGGIIRFERWIPTTILSILEKPDPGEDEHGYR